MADNSNNTKKSHFVPRAYLSFFHINGDNKRIWELDKARLISSRKMIIEVAQQRYFYRENLYDGSFDNSLETDWQVIENKTKEVINKVIEDIENGSKISIHQPELAEQMAMLFFRTKSMRESMENILQGEGEKIVEMVPNADMTQIHTFDPRRYHIDFLKNEPSPQFWVWTEYLKYYEWSPFHYKSGEVITSDNPIALFIGFGEEELPEDLKDEALGFIFPISPNYIMLALNPAYTEHIGIQSNGKVSTKGPLHRSILDQNFINHCVTSSRSLFSHKDDFQLAVSFFEENPETRLSSQE